MVNDSTINTDVYQTISTLLSSSLIVSSTITPKITGLFPDEDTDFSKPVVTLGMVDANRAINTLDTYGFDVSMDLVVSGKKAVDVETISQGICDLLVNTPISGLTLLGVNVNSNYLQINNQNVRSKTISLNWMRQ